MVRAHEVIGKINKKEFSKRLSGLSEKDIEITSHTLFRLNENQRKVYEEKVLQGFLLNKSPLEIHEQRNGNYAVFYEFNEKRVLKILIKFNFKKIYIVTFYILNREQMEELKNGRK